MEEWKEIKLGEIAEFRTGKLNSNAAVHKGKYPFFTCAPETYFINDYAFDQKAILLAGNNADGNFNIKYYEGRFNAYQRTYVINPISSEIDILFLYYALQLCLQQFKALSQGTSTKFLTAKILNAFSLKVPTITTQQKIVGIIKSLDDKIEVNRRINDNLEQQAQALFKSRFVDFEPFKNGEFVESELGMIPKGWRIVNLFDVAEVLDKYRKPLSGQEREKMAKIYPYYGATSCMDYVDNFIFDGVYTLIGEDGSVIKEDGLPYMQYVWGKLWVNNHAHILQGKNGFSTEMLHVMLSITNIRHLVTGAVQAKLSQANMQKIKMALPSIEILNQVRPIFDAIYQTRRNMEDESSRLSSLRDTLLPRLMSGELKINDISV